MNLRRLVPPDLQSGSFNHSDNLPERGQRDLDPQPPDRQSGTLPIELRPLSGLGGNRTLVLDCALARFTVSRYQNQAPVLLLAIRTVIYVRLLVLVTAVIIIIIVHFLSFAKIWPTPVIGELIACLLYRQFYHKTLICQTLFLIISLNSLAIDYS